jgi:excisionase family DNA binding protein
VPEIRVVQPEEESFYTAKTLAERLSCSERTAKRMIDEGEIASYHFRGMRRVDPADLRSYLAEHREERKAAA